MVSIYFDMDKSTDRYIEICEDFTRLDTYAGSKTYRNEEGNEIASRKAE